MVVPFLIFQVLHELAKMLLLGHQFELQVVTPTWTLWFLLALLMWRLVTPVLRILRYPLVFTVAIAMITPLDQLGRASCRREDAVRASGEQGAGQGAGHEW